MEFGWSKSMVIGSADIRNEDVCLKIIFPFSTERNPVSRKRRGSVQQFPIHRSSGVDVVLCHQSASLHVREAVDHDRTNFVGHDGLLGG